MSPEQVSGENLDARSDIFSFGAVLYEMTTGQRPFQSSKASDLALQIVNCQPAPVRTLAPKAPVDLHRIIEKAMARRRDDRYQTTDDLAVDLKRLGKELDSGSMPSYDDLQRVAPRWRRTNIRARTFLAIVLLAAGVLGWRTWSRRQSAPSIGIPRVLVLPMDVLSETEGAAHLGQAFSEAVAINLAQTPGIVVLPVWEGPLGANGKRQRPREAGLSEGANQVVNGSLSRVGDSLQVTVSLIDVAQNQMSWGTHCSAGSADITAIAASLAQQLVTKLGATPPKLYDFVLNLRPEADDPLWGEALGGLRREDSSVYLPATERLVEKHPGNVDALALRACALFYQEGLDGNPKALKALEDVMGELERIDPKEPTADCIRLTLLAAQGHPEETMKSATKIIERRDLTPAARAWALRDRAGTLESPTWRFDSAIKDAQEALRLDPANYFNPFVLAAIYQNQHQLDKALIYAQQAIALSPCFQAYMVTSDILKEMGREAQSLDYAAMACETGKRAGYCARFAIRLLQAGRGREAQSVVDKIAAMPESARGAYDLGCFYALKGDRANAIRSLRRSLELGLALRGIEQDEDLVALHGTPEFTAIVAEAKRHVDQETTP